MTAPPAGRRLGLADTERENALLVGIIDAISAGPALQPLAASVARLSSDVKRNSSVFLPSIPLFARAFSRWIAISRSKPSASKRRPWFEARSSMKSRGSP